MKNNLSHHHVIDQVPVDYYQKGVSKNYFQKTWHINKLNVVLRFIKNTKPKKILDVGCASGWFLSQVSKHYPNTKCYGIDLYEKAILYGIKEYPHLELSVSDAHEIPYKSRKFDVIICTEVLEHVDNPEKVLLEIKRLLKKRGIVVIELDSGSILFSVIWYLWRKVQGKVWNDSHLHSFNSKKLHYLLKQCGFNVLKKKIFNFGMAIAFLVEKK